MSHVTNSWSVDETDYVYSACRGKKENSSCKRYKMSKWSFDDAVLVTAWNTVHCHVALY